MSIYKDGKLIAGGRQCMPLLSFMWADHQLNDASWLNSTTFSWQSGAVYQAAYQHLVDDYTNANYIIADNVTYFRYAAGDTGSVYCWKSQSDVTRFTTTETPVVGGLAYHSSDLPAAGDEITDVKLADTETISGITITYYKAADGHKLVLPDQESNVMAIYNATGVAWYYIIDTTNQRFKLPRTKFGFTGIRSGVGNYVEAGLPNITGTISMRDSATLNSSGAWTTKTGAFKSNTGNYSIIQASASGGWGPRQGNINFKASDSDSIYGNSTTVQPKATEMYLYFYVGNFTQTALENTAGLNAELFNGKADLSTVAHVVTEFQEPTAANNQTWYRKYADGWVEQGILFHDRANSSTWTFPIPMTEGGYDSQITNVSGTGPRFAFVRGRYATYLTYNAADDSSENNDGTYTIRVCGMAAN